MEDHAKTHTLLERAEAFARSRLSERRYEHTLRVADTAQRLALAHDLDADRARLAALLHDAARETGPEEYLKLADQWHLQVGDPERQSPKLLHGPVAAELARRELGIDDEEVLDCGQGPHDGEAGDGAARARSLRRGQDRTSPRLPKRGTPAHSGQRGSTPGGRGVVAARHSPQRRARQGHAPREPQDARLAEGRSHRAIQDRVSAERRG